MANLCNLDGTILREEAAAVPVLDRGFLFGDSIYEVMRTIGGVPFAWPEHLLRLRFSAAGLGMSLDLTDGDLMRRVRDTMARAGHAESYVRIVVTRGSGTAPSIDLASGAAIDIINAAFHTASKTPRPTESSQKYRPADETKFLAKSGTPARIDRTESRSTAAWPG